MKTIDAMIDTLRSAEARAPTMSAAADLRIRARLNRETSAPARWATAILVVATLCTSVYALGQAKPSSPARISYEDAGVFDLGLADASGARAPEGAGGPSTLP